MSTHNDSWAWPRSGDYKGLSSNSVLRHTSTTPRIYDSNPCRHLRLPASAALHHDPTIPESTLVRLLLRTDTAIELNICTTTASTASSVPVERGSCVTNMSI
jgi:hypothetical protein